MIQLNKTCELISILRKSRFIIYGTGVIGKRFYHGLKRIGIEKNLQAFVVSEKPEKTTFEGVPKRAIYDDIIKRKIQEEKCIICIAVHEASLFSVIDMIKSVNGQFCAYTWVSPFIMDLLFGKPICLDKEVEISRIFKNKEMAADLGLACKWAAIEQFYGLRVDGYDLYIKGMSAYVNSATAYNRLNQFLNVLKSYDASGHYNNIIIDSDYNILDGRHRFVLGIYHGKSSLKATVYKKPYEYDDDQRPISINAECLIEHGVIFEDVTILKDIMRVILNKAHIETKLEM